jgi:PAP2 superfamily C-terminal
MLVKFLSKFDFNLWKDSDFILSIIKAICFLNIVLLINYKLTNIATNSASSPVSDLLFNVLPYVDTSFIDKYVAYYISYVIAFLVIFYSKKSIELIYGISFLILLRSVFINLTHLGIPVGITPTKSFFTGGGDLFFSGHVALPFLVMLIFWEVKYLRYFFLATTFVMGVEVLLGRFHYSIDVFSAPFFVFCVYTFTRYIFNKNKGDIIL